MGNQPSHFDYSPPTTTFASTSYNHPATTAGGGAGMSPYSRHGHWIPPPSHPNGMSRQHHGWYQSSSYYSPAAASYSNAAAAPPHAMMASNPVGGAAAANGYPYYSNQYMAHGYHHHPPHHPVRYVYMAEICFASHLTNVINALLSCVDITMQGLSSHCITAFDRIRT